MGNIAVKVENLGKMYHIGGPQEAYQTFRDAITRTISAPFKRARDLLSGQAYGAAGLTEEIWALKDVSFEVKHGEVIGIIGRNGAGKSTLLKILSQITEPTTGYADIYGRVGALLEVGTGFHPELTGRENVYLNGAILGMSRNDINRKFDEIVEFAGVEKFIDTPVKHYSSGMGLRLGFSVAAHLEPEILVVDEVLAVGDAEFQKKCLGKMSDVASEGRTVLFVSHNMSAIRSLCQHAIWLKQGQVLEIGESTIMVAEYLRSVSQSDIESINGISVHISFTTERGEPVIQWHSNERITVKIKVDMTLPIDSPAVDLSCFSLFDDARLFSLHTDTFVDSSPISSATSLSVDFHLINVGIASPEIYFNIGVRTGPTLGKQYIAHFTNTAVMAVDTTGYYHLKRKDCTIYLPVEAQINYG